jgi:glycosyltransferase involved in cell wall biosynthesis
MWFNKTVGIVFPAYDEAPNIQTAVREFLAVKDSSGNQIVDEVLVVDNNSKDGTADLARAAGAVVITETKQGYGNAVQCGLRSSKKDIIIMCEPDGTFVASDLLKLLTYSEDFEMVCGTRTTSEMVWQAANMKWSNRVANSLVAKIMQVLYGTCSISDCGCTFRLVRRSAVAKMEKDFHVGKSHFLPNMVIAASTNGVTMIEIPVTYRGRVGESKITGNLKGLIRTALNMIALIFTSWPRFLLRKSKIAN